MFDVGGNLSGDLKLVGDKRRFIVPPVLDKSTLLSHESICNLWWQAKRYALRGASNLYVIGYSLPETDIAMQTLLWEGRRSEQGDPLNKIRLYVVDIDKKVVPRYRKMLGAYYEVDDTYAGAETFLTGSWKTTFEQAAAAYDGPITNLAARHPRHYTGPAAPVGGKRLGVRPLNARRLPDLRPAHRLRLRRGGGGTDVLPSRHPAMGGSTIRG